MLKVIGALLALSSPLAIAEPHVCSCGTTSAQIAPPKPSVVRPLDRVSADAPFARLGIPIEDGSRIDLLVVYTPASRAAAGGVAQIEADIDAALFDLNSALTDSGIATQVFLAHTQEVAYSESGGASTQLNNLREPGDGVLDEVHDIRDEHKADLVMMISNALEVCGIANFGFELNTPQPENAFSVVLRGCLNNGGFTFAHEIGHNLGLRHDWLAAPCDNGGVDHGKGHVAPDLAFQTIMGIETSVLRIGRFSNPDLSFSAQPTGVPIGSPNEAHGADAIAIAAPFAARFRDRDMNANGVLDTDEIAMGTLDDCNANGYPDQFEQDFNRNGTPDDCDIALGTSADLDLDGVPDGSEAPVLFVNDDASGLGTGLSWADAMTGLHDALDLAHASGDIDEIWVAQGTYAASFGAQRNRSFDLVSGTSLYGGFDGTETTRDERPETGATTILTGDTLGDDLPGAVNRADNALHVIFGFQENERIVIDRFTITGGAATREVNCGSFIFTGGGMCLFSSDVVITDCVFEENTGVNGSALAVINAGSSIIARNLFERNKAVDAVAATAVGPAIFHGSVTVDFSGMPDGELNQFINNTVRFNEANSDCSGVWLSGNPIFANNLVVHNIGYGPFTNAGVLGILNTDLRIVNSTIAHNTAPNGSGNSGVGVATSRGMVTLVNSIVWNNTAGGNPPTLNNQIRTTGTGSGNAADYSIVDQWTSGIAGVGSSGADPMFADPMNGDFTLSPMSPAIDSADTGALPTDFFDLDDDLDTLEPLPIDLLGNTRATDDPDTPDTGVGGAPAADMGAFEFQPGTPCPADLSGNGVTDFPDVGLFLSAFTTGDLAADFSGNGTADFPDVGLFLAAFAAGCP